MSSVFRNLSVVVLFGLGLVACGEGEAPDEKITATAVEETAVQLPAEAPEVPVVDVIEKASIEVHETAAPLAESVEEMKPEEEEATEPVANVNPQTHTINAEARGFKPDTIYINSGDTVAWRNMTSHNTVSIAGLIPESATPWTGKLGENLKVTLDVDGIYAYVCQPHIGFGMVGLIVVGTPTNLEQVKAHAAETLKGPFRRVIGKLNKVSVP